VPRPSILSFPIPVPCRTELRRCTASLARIEKHRSSGSMPSIIVNIELLPVPNSSTSNTQCLARKANWVRWSRSPPQAHRKKGSPQAVGLRRRRLRITVPGTNSSKPDMPEPRSVRIDRPAGSMTGLNALSASTETAIIRRFDHDSSLLVREAVAAEEPLEIRLEFGPREHRVNQAISITMRTPGHDRELAAGFLYTEGVIGDLSDLDEGAQSTFNSRARNCFLIAIAPNVEVNTGSLSRNFYTTSSCGICGKASLLALQTVCPPRMQNSFEIGAEVLFRLPELLRARQALFKQTGGLHAAALFTAEGVLEDLREDVGRHNALDKLIGSALLDDKLPLRDRILMLSGRASFELLQKALMAGIPMVAAVGAPSTLAIEVAREFDITLIGFLRPDHFNVYNGAERVRPATTSSQQPESTLRSTC
jgi:FdhD protein